MIKVMENIKSKKIIWVVLLVVITSSFVAHNVYAVTGNEALNAVFGGVGVAVATVVGIFAYLLTTVFGLALTAMAALLVQVAQYSDIINVPAVKQGWVIIRDLCNMFFVLIFLIIAFATILRIENYSAKRLLPKLIIMAILINFSKTIFGLLIDFSQIVMLTFVVAFKNGGGWFMDAFRVQKWYTFNSLDDTAAAATQWGTVVAMILSVFASAVALIMVIVIVAVLVIRIVMLWIYTILSPFVFLGWAFPPVGKYTEQIWTDFVKQLIVGPVLAFFLWLALAFGVASSNTLSLTASGSEVCAGVSGLFCTGELQKFIIMLGMMLGGLMTAQSVGGAGAKAANWGMNKIKTGQAWAQNKASRGFQDVTRISAAKEYMGMRTAQKESARTERIQAQAHSIAGGVALVKENTVGRAGGYINEKWQKIGGNKAKELREANEGKQTELAHIEGMKGVNYENYRDKFASSALDRDISSGKFETGKGADKTSYQKTAYGDWHMTNSKGVFSVTDSEIAAKKNDIKESWKENDDNWTKHNFDNDRNTKIADLKTDIHNNEADADIATRRQSTWNNIAKFGIAPIAYSAAALTGPWSLSGVHAVATAATGKDAGSDEKKLVSKYRNEQVSKKKSDMAGFDTSELRAVLKDTGKDAYSRMAAMLELMNKKELSSGEVDKYKGDLQKLAPLGGAKLSKTGVVEGWNDKKLNTYYNAAIESKYSEKKSPMTNLDSTDADTQRQASIDVQDNYDNGTYKIGDMSFDALTKSIDELARGVSNGKFTKEWSGYSTGTQQTLIAALASAKEEKAQMKLALVNFKEATKRFGKDKMADITSKMSGEDIAGLAKSGDKQMTSELAEAIEEAVNKKGTDGFTHSAQSYFDSKAGQAFLRSTKKDHLFPSNP